MRENGKAIAVGIDQDQDQDRTQIPGLWRDEEGEIEEVLRHMDPHEGGIEEVEKGRRIGVGEIWRRTRNGKGATTDAKGAATSGEN